MSSKDDPWICECGEDWNKIGDLPGAPQIEGVEKCPECSETDFIYALEEIREDGTKVIAKFKG